MSLLSARKSFLTLGLIVSLCLAATSASAAAMKDVPYTFDAQKLSAAKNPFHFLRTYVDYFYLLIQANRSEFRALPHLWRTQGWCVGDAHPENFGFLVQQNNSSEFVMNDMDDSGPCPLSMDLLRLMVSSRLYDNGTDLSAMLDAYRAGITGEPAAMPAALAEMQHKSLKRADHIKSKDAKADHLERTSETEEVTAPERLQIQNAFVALPQVLPPTAKIIDMLQTSKVGGGSGGMLRYEILIQAADGGLVHLELKREITPSIYPVALGPIPDTKTRIATTVLMAQGAGASVDYQVVTTNNLQMLVRPRFSGNIGVSLDKQSLADNREIILFEAHQLGVTHSRSVYSAKKWSDSLANVAVSDWEADVSLMTGQFESKFAELKPAPVTPPTK